LRLTKTFLPDQYAEALESWAWIGLDGNVPVLSSLFGHVFLQSVEGYWYLDVFGGSLELLWPDAAALQAVLDSAEGQDEFLLGGIALATDRQGLALAANQVYDFNPPPVLGGLFDVANVVANDFVVAVNIGGQIHDQLRGRPAGTKVQQVTIDAALEPKKSKFWQRNR
jgi:hypothetical protein